VLKKGLQGIASPADPFLQLKCCGLVLFDVPVFIGDAPFIEPSLGPAAGSSPGIAEQYIIHYQSPN
jgi:hypothetical protein